MNPGEPTADSVATALKQVRARIKTAAEACGRDADEIRLLAVSKAKPIAMIIEAVAAEQMAFGENYVQEACHKLESIDDPRIEWHFIGSIQSNKTRRIAVSFSWVHSIDRESTLRHLSRHRLVGLPPINVCVQINLDREKTKSGVAPESAEQLLDTASRLPGITPRGLMVIPALASSMECQRRVFATAKSIFDRYASAYSLDTLSMGMSGDFEAAIAEGATLVRLGTVIFGRRVPKNKPG